MPGWQEVYEQLKDQNFEIIAVAQDTLGEAAAGEWYDAAPLTYTTLIDVTHRITTHYNLVNVPSGIWVDEQGRVRRIDEGTYSRVLPIGNGSVGTDDYTPAVHDWVTQGEDSPYVWSRGEVVERIRRKTSDETLANPTFKLGVYFLVQGNETLARHYWEAAQQLAPDNWNFHRQDWNLTEGLAGPSAEASRKDGSARRSTVLRPARSSSPAGVVATAPRQWRFDCPETMGLNDRCIRCVGS